MSITPFEQISFLIFFGLALMYHMLDLQKNVHPRSEEPGDDDVGKGMQPTFQPFVPVNSLSALQFF